MKKTLLLLLLISFNLLANKYIEYDFDVYGSPSNSGLGIFGLIILAVIFIIADLKTKKEIFMFVLKIIGFFGGLFVFFSLCVFLTEKIVLYLFGTTKTLLSPVIFGLLIFGGIFIFKMILDKIYNIPSKNE